MKKYPDTFALSVSYVLTVGLSVDFESFLVGITIEAIYPKRYVSDYDICSSGPSTVTINKSYADDNLADYSVGSCSV